jgi:hypothetical protein
MAETADYFPYTHWAYFEREEDAERCKAELEPDCRLVFVERQATEIGPPFLLRAARLVSTETDWHAPIEAIVERYGGLYDFGEMGEEWLRAAVAEGA